MTIELIIISHDHVGESLLHTTYSILEKQAIPAHNIAITHNDDPTDKFNTITTLIESIDKNNDILIKKSTR